MKLILKLYLLSIPLLAYRYVYDFRINQEVILKLFTIILLTFWILKVINSEEYTFNWTRLCLPLLLFTLSLIFSLLISNLKFLVSFHDFALFFSYILIFFIITNHLNKETDFHSFINLFFLISVLISLYTLLQYYGLDPYLGEMRCLTSTLGQKNWISNYLAMFFPALFFYFLREENKKKRFLYLIYLSIIYTNLMICQSRGIWISIAITILIGIFLIFKFKLPQIFQENRRSLILILIIFLALTLIYSTENPLNRSALTVIERARSTFDEYDPSINTRILIWRTTLEMMKNNPLLGLGIGSFKMNYLSYQAEYLKDHPQYLSYYGKAGEAHNEYLQMCAELGIIGLLIFMVFILSFYNLILDYLKKNQDYKDKIMVLGLVLGLTCFLIHGLFCFPFHVPALGVTFFSLLGLTVSYTQINSSNQDTNDSTNNYKKGFKIKNKAIRAVLTILILIGLISSLFQLVIKPYAAELTYFSGLRHNVDGNYEQALSCFQQASSLSSSNGRILHALGTAYYNSGDLARAEEFLQRASRYIVDVNTFYNLGLVYRQAGLLSQAEEEFKYALYLMPESIKVCYELGYLYFVQERYEETIENWNKILEIEPDFANRYILLNNLGIVYQKKGKADKALEYFLEALKETPDNSPILKDIEQELLNIFLNTNVSE